MMILAGVSLNATVGDNGIITRAQEAKFAQEDAEWNQNAEFIMSSAMIDKDNIEALTEEQQAEIQAMRDRNESEEKINAKIE